MGPAGSNGTWAENEETPSTWQMTGLEFKRELRQLFNVCSLRSLFALGDLKFDSVTLV